MEKMTKREVLTALLNGEMEVSNPYAIAYFENELKLLNAKSANRKHAADKEENVEAANKIVSLLEAKAVPMTATDIGLSIGVSTSKATSLLKVLSTTDRVKRVTEKGKPFFSIC